MEARTTLQSATITLLFIGGTVLVAHLVQVRRHGAQPALDRDADYVELSPDPATGPPLTDSLAEGSASRLVPRPVRQPGDPPRLPPGADRNFWVITDAQFVADRANEGHHFIIRHNNQNHLFQLYFVTVPDEYPRDLSAEERSVSYFGHTDPIHLREVGATARRRVAELLSTRPFTIFTRWQRVGQSSRYYAFILVEHLPGKRCYLSEWLVSKGLAMIEGETSDLPLAEISAQAFGRSLRGYERDAQQRGIGAWARTPAAAIPIELPSAR